MKLFVPIRNFFLVVCAIWDNCLFVIATEVMSTTLTPPAPSLLKSGGTRILIDLQRELTPEELEKFVSAAEAAGAASLTDHFLNLTLRLPERRTA